MIIHAKGHSVFVFLIYRKKKETVDWFSGPAISTEPVDHTLYAADNINIRKETDTTANLSAHGHITSLFRKKKLCSARRACKGHKTKSTSNIRLVAFS